MKITFPFHDIKKILITQVISNKSFYWQFYNVCLPKKCKIIFHKTNTSSVCLAFIWTRESDDAKSVLWIICGAVIYWWKIKTVYGRERYNIG